MWNRWKMGMGVLLTIVMVGMMVAMVGVVLWSTVTGRFSRMRRAARHPRKPGRVRH